MMQFWELDTDHDFYICKEDLLRYGNHSLTYRIVDRIFSQVSWRRHSIDLFPEVLILLCQQCWDLYTS